MRNISSVAPVAEIPGLFWRQPAKITAGVVDAVKVAPAVHGVVLGSTLGGVVVVSGTAWADFVAAVKAGEYDSLI